MKRNSCPLKNKGRDVGGVREEVKRLKRDLVKLFIDC